jgi:integrase
MSKRALAMALLLRYSGLRIRHTFAVSLLQKGVSIEIVSVRLAHSSMRVTERHYAPCVKARQEQLEAAVRKAWCQVRTFDRRRAHGAARGHGGRVAAA